jgi:hypothetical protein
METELKEILEKLEKDTSNIKCIIGQDLEGYNTKEQAISYLKDVCQYGGVSGIISGLIYYDDTNKFYDDNEEEIEAILEEFKDNCGYNSRTEAIMNLNGSAEDIRQEKNLLSWMAYEEVARQVLTDDFIFGSDDYGRTN